MKNKNIEKALEISNLWKRDECESPSQDECIAYDAAIRMADAKDAALKQFLIEHISTDAVVETNDDGEPYADSFIAAGEARLKAAEEVFNRYKQFEERML